MSANATGAESTGAEAEELLASLIRFNTVNPPGNELAAQEYLADHLAVAGFECELLGAEPTPDRSRSSWRGGVRTGAGAAAAGPTLCYLGHVDTVLADPAEWTHDPWSGDLADGFLWGRGALDMKSQVAAEVAAAASLARSGWRPARGELLIVVVVDEETGGIAGRGMAHQEPSREGPLRHARQRGRRRGVRVRRQAPLRRVLRGEGRLPLQAHHRRRRRPRLDARAWARTRC